MKWSILLFPYLHTSYDWKENFAFPHWRKIASYLKLAWKKTDFDENYSNNYPICYRRPWIYDGSRIFILQIHKILHLDFAHFFHMRFEITTTRYMMARNLFNVDIYMFVGKGENFYLTNSWKLGFTFTFLVTL